MEDQEILSQLSDIISKTVRKKDLTITPETTAKDVPGWDSLTHMIIIDSIEKHFKVKFKLNEIMNFKNVGDTITCIKGKRVK